MKADQLSERNLAEKAGISRGTLRSVLHHSADVTLRSMNKVANALGINLHISTEGKFLTEYTAIASSYKVLSGGHESWKIHYMDMVDEFYRTKDPDIFTYPPAVELSDKLTALLSSIVSALCLEYDLTPPGWAARTRTLHKPWFVSDMESLKASALTESPWAFRRNNIFVLSNFLSRA